MLTKTLLAAAVIAAYPVHGHAAEQGETAPARTAPVLAQSAAGQQSIAQSQGKSYAQELVLRTAAKHPELLELDLHTTPPGESASVIIASKNASRIGHSTDADDREVMKTGIPFVEINKVGNQNVEVHVPLLDVSRKTVGVVEMTFPYPAGSGFDQDELVKAAERVRDEMSRYILDQASLTEPLQGDARIPVDTYAQVLVDELLARHPQIEVVVIHARPPGGADYPIVASNIGRIGKPADASDLEVINTGQPHVATDASGSRVEAKLALQDQAGATVGALAIIFPLKRTQDEATVLRQAVQMRDELRPRIASPDKLFEASTVERSPSIAVEATKEVDQTALGNKQSLPMTKEVVSAAALQNAQEYSEAVKNQAGVAPSSSKGSPSDTISIRGINLNPISNYRINGGLAVAGVMTVPTEDKERLETLKGANALMFGIASPAGIINLVTKRAANVDTNTATLSGSSFGQYYGSLDVGRRFGLQKEAGLRANFSAAHLENGVKDASGHGEFAAIGGDWRVTDRLTLQADVEYYRKNTILQAAVSLLAPVNGAVPVPQVPNPRNLLSGTWATFAGNTTNIQTRADFAITDNWRLIGEIGRSDSDRSRFVTRIGKYDPVTGANGTVTVSIQDQSFLNKFERAELLGRFATGPLVHDLTLGISASERDALTPGQNSVILPQKQNIFDPVELPPPQPTKPSTSLPPQVSKDTGLYTYDTVGIGSKLKVLLGFRQTKSKQDNGIEQNSATVNSPAGGFLYDILPTTTLFASYMKGLEDGAVAPVNAANANEIQPPGISKQKEIGLRNSFFRGLSISASYFDISRVNAVTDPVTNIFSNNGTIHYQGIEAVIAYEINRQWTINAAGQHLNSTQLSSDPKVDHLTPENTPKFIGNVYVTHRSPLIPGLSITGGASYVTERFVNPQDQGTIPGYTLLSASAGYVWKVAARRAAVQLSIDNLGNKRYWNSAQQGTFGTGMDRSFKLNAKLDF